MPIDDRLKHDLEIIVKNSNFKTDNSVFDNSIVEESSLPKEEASRYLSQLELIRLVKIGVRPSGSDPEVNQYNKAGY